MKNLLFAILLILCLSCQEKKETKNENMNSTQSFFVGTYTADESQGIYRYSIDDLGKLKKIGLAAITDNPSFLTKSSDGKYLLAVNENEKGTVTSFTIQNDSLITNNSQSTGGAHPCHVSLNNEGYVLTSNYTGGNIGLLKLNEQGHLSDLLDVQQHVGHPSIEAQKTPHAHSTRFQSGIALIAVDLGINQLLFSTIDTAKNKLIQKDSLSLDMEPGAGPRHLTKHPNQPWIYVVNELNSTVTQLIKNDAGNYQKQITVSTLPKDFNADSYCADIHISKDGRFLYASNRGHNSIAIFEINKNDGSPKLIATESIKGDWPRNFALSPDENFLIVANQRSKNMVSFKRNTESGLLKYVDQIKAPTPVCILF